MDDVTLKGLCPEDDSSGAIRRAMQAVEQARLSVVEKSEKLKIERRRSLLESTKAEILEIESDIDDLRLDEDRLALMAEELVERLKRAEKQDRLQEFADLFSEANRLHEEAKADHAQLRDATAHLEKIMERLAEANRAAFFFNQRVSNDLEASEARAAGCKEVGCVLGFHLGQPVYSGATIGLHGLVRLLMPDGAAGDLFWAPRLIR